MKETKPTYKEQIEIVVYDLMYYALTLADIVDQTVDEHGMIKVQHRFASEIIHHTQQAAKRAAEELTLITSGVADLSEIYPIQKGGGKTKETQTRQEVFSSRVAARRDTEGTVMTGHLPNFTGEERISIAEDLRELREILNRRKNRKGGAQ